MTASQAWKFVTLTDVGTVVTGNTPPTKELHYYGNDIPFVKPTELVDKPIHAAPQMLSYAGAEVARKVPAGAVLVSCIGNLGKTGIARVPVSLNQQINAIVFRNEVLPEFGFYYVQTLKRWLHGQSSATTIPIVNKGKFLQAPFPLAPLEDQRRIVAEIEKQFSRLDEAVAGLKRVKANLKRYKASILKAAVEGRLVPTEADLAHGEGRDYETGAQLLQRILETRRRQWQGKGKYKEPVTPNTTDLAELPEGWVWATVDQLLRERIVNGLSVKESTSPTTVKALRLSAMTNQGLDYYDCRYLPVSEHSVRDIVVCESDFFVSRGNGSLNLVGRGSRAQVPTQIVIFPDTMMRLRLTTVANVLSWVEAIWPGRFVREQVESRVKTTAGIYKMAQPELASIALPIPPLAEQHRIVAEVDRLLSITREAEAEVETNLKRAQSLRQTILAKSFNSQC